jgi:hypothetical protein
MKSRILTSFGEKVLEGIVWAFIIGVVGIAIVGWIS